MNKENILGFDVCDTNFTEIVESILDDFKKGSTNFIVNINPEIIIKNLKNNNLINTFNKQKYQIPDGIGMVYASRINKGKIKNRITGIDLMQEICKKVEGKNEKIFLYGSKQGIAQKAKNELEKKYTNINIVDVCDGYTDEEIVLKKINDSDANILFVGLGSPKQEEFIIRNKEKLKSVRIFMPVGRKFRCYK